jgi:hypothetical protein
MKNEKCPRCGIHSLENLATHSHCWECAYSPEYCVGVAGWRGAEFRKQTLVIKPQPSTTAMNIGQISRPVL